MDSDPDLLIGRRNGEHLALWVVGRMHPAATDYWDGNWLSTPIELVVGAFRAMVDAQLRADELSRFREQLEELDRSSKGTATLESMEHWIDLRVVVSSLGALVITGVLTDRPGLGNRLSFELAADLHVADLRSLAASMRAIESSFPVIGRP